MWTDPAFYASVFLVLVALSAVLYFARKPLRFLLRLSVRCALAAFLLVLCNTLGASRGWYMGVNPVTCVSVGILGLPGLVGLYLLKWLI